MADLPTGVVVHMPGDQITVKGVSRQRCLWCGALVAEQDWNATGVQIMTGQTGAEALAAAQASRWTGFTAIDGNATYAVDAPPAGGIPAGSCMLLDPEVTR